MVTSHETQALKLAAAVDLMDQLAHEGMSEISAIAKLALKSLESPDGYRQLDNIAHALQAIWSKADDTQQCIHDQAVEVHCAHVDQAERRRLEAWRTFHEQEAARARQ